ncbi:MAG: hypothetical protein AAF333_05375 [Planctomycetota bacterium]
MEVVVSILQLVAGLALLGFLIVLPVGIVMVFVASWRDQTRQRVPPRAMSLNSRIYGVLMVLFLIVDISGCASLVLRAIP